MTYSYFPDKVKICIESFVHQDIVGGGEGEYKLRLQGRLEGQVNEYIEVKEVKGKLLIYYSSGKAIYSEEINSKESKGNLYSLPLRAEGVGYESKEDRGCKRGRDNPLIKEVREKVELLRRYPPLYITKDLNLLWDNHRPFVPELGDIIPFNQLSKVNYRKQDRVLFKILAVTKNCGTNQVRTNWIVTLVEYQGQPVLVLLNHMWDEIINYPHRYILNRSLYRQLLNYLLSLFQEEKGLIRMDGTINKELYCIAPPVPSKEMRVIDCFTSKWEENCVTVEDSAAQAEQLISTIDRFISIYTNR